MVDLLLIEDNIELAQLIYDFLEKDGFTIHHARSGEDGLDYIHHNSVRLVLLDIMLPGIDGLAVCKQIRVNKNVPILILSARIGKDDKIFGLELGADDYIEKPFDMDVLRAKIRAHIRRNYEFSSDRKQITDGDLTIDTDATTAYLKECPVNLSVKEYELLLLFLQNKGKTLRKEWIFDRIWGADSFSEPSTLTVHINKLREKIEASPREPKRIITVWGIGYKYETI